MSNNVNWKNVYKEFIRKCVDTEYYPVERKKLNMSPDELFEWFKKEVERNIK